MKKSAFLFLTLLACSGLISGCDSNDRDPCETLYFTNVVVTPEINVGPFTGDTVTVRARVFIYDRLRELDYVKVRIQSCVDGTWTNHVTYAEEIAEDYDGDEKVYDPRIDFDVITDCPGESRIGVRVSIAHVSGAVCGQESFEILIH